MKTLGSAVPEMCLALARQYDVDQALLDIYFEILQSK